MKGRWPALMRDYGLMPWQTGDLTEEEWTSILTDQNTHWKALRDADRKQKRQRGRR